MTVHNFVASLATGEAQPIPDNCEGPGLVYYGKSRLGVGLVTFEREGRQYIGRQCPSCGRS